MERWYAVSWELKSLVSMHNCTCVLHYFNALSTNKLLFSVSIFQASAYSLLLMYHLSIYVYSVHAEHERLLVESSHTNTESR